MFPAACQGTNGLHHPQITQISQIGNFRGKRNSGDASGCLHEAATAKESMHYPLTSPSLICVICEICGLKLTVACKRWLGFFAGKSFLDASIWHKPHDGNQYV
jgi:hypothetical protein